LNPSIQIRADPTLTNDCECNETVCLSQSLNTDQGSSDHELGRRAPIRVGAPSSQSLNTDPGSSDGDSGGYCPIEQNYCPSQSLHTHQGNSGSRRSCYPGLQSRSPS